jgi:hypothetical protein
MNGMIPPPPGYELVIGGEGGYEKERIKHKIYARGDKGQN